MYYLRTKSAVNAIKFTLNNDKKKKVVKNENEAMSKKEFQQMLAKSKDNPEDCIMCGS